MSALFLQHRCGHFNIHTTTSNWIDKSCSFLKKIDLGPTDPGCRGMSDISTTDVGSFQSCDRSILSNGVNASTGRPDANSSIFRQGGLKPAQGPRMSYLFSTGVLVLPGANNINSSNFLSEEHQRLARDAGSQAVLYSSARFEITLSWKMRQAQFTHESTTQHTERSS